MKHRDLPPWHGYFAATITTFNNDFSIDESAFEKILRWLVAEGMHGIAVAGTTGEWPSLESEERMRLFEIARDIVPAHIPLIGGASACNMRETLRYVQRCGDLGLSGILLTIPPYLQPTDDAIVEFYRHIAKTSRLPIIVYNWPSGTGKDLDPALLLRLADIENVVAIKNSTANLSAFIDALRRLREKVRVFGVMPGDVGLGLLRHIGGDGCIGAAGALGRIQPGFFDAALAGDDKNARALGKVDQALMSEFFDGFSGKYGHAIATIKELMTARGLPAGPVRPPLLALGAEGKARIHEFVKRNGLGHAP